MDDIEASNIISTFFGWKMKYNLRKKVREAKKK